MSNTIRPATINDIPALVILRREIAIYHLQFDSWYALNEEANEAFKSHLATIIPNTNQCFLVAEDNVKLTGYAYGFMMGPAPIFIAHKRGYIDEFGVSESARGKGIGEALLNELMAWFKSKEVERVELKVDALNTDGINFWRKHGFNNTQIRMGKEV